MTDFPKSLSQYYRSIDQRNDPVAIEVDQVFRVTEIWGDAKSFGFDNLQIGDDFSQKAEFAIGALENVPSIFPMIALGDSYTDVHVLAQGNRYVFLLIDTTIEAARRQQTQQVKNDLKLANIVQRKLLAKQKLLISDLIATHAELESQRRNLSELNARSSQFLATISHDFRTPLSSVIAYASQLKEEVADVPHLLEVIKPIVRGSQHLLGMVDNILDTARLETESFQLQNTPVDLRSTIADVTLIMAPLAAEKGLAFSADMSSDVPEQVLTDAGAVRQILINLIGNAVKFTDTGEVRVNLTRQNETLCFAVEDTGPGIAPADQAKIFAEFQRVDHAQQGAGLGLSIVQRLTDMMGGELTLTSMPGLGTKIQVTLPLVQSLSPTTGTAQSDSTKPPQKVGVILMVEDNTDIRKLAQLALGRAGHSLKLAADGLEAIHLSMQAKFDLVLMDVNLPSMSGTEAAQQIRQLGFAGKIIAFTANKVSKEELDQAFDGVISKPITMPALLEALHDLL